MMALQENGPFSPVHLSHMEGLRVAPLRLWSGLLELTQFARDDIDSTLILLEGETSPAIEPLWGDAVDIREALRL